MWEENIYFKSQLNMIIVEEIGRIIKKYFDGKYKIQKEDDRIYYTIDDSKFTIKTDNDIRFVVDDIQIEFNLEKPLKYSLEEVEHILWHIANGI